MSNAVAKWPKGRAVCRLAVVTKKGKIILPDGTRKDIEKWIERAGPHHGGCRLAMVRIEEIKPFVPL